MKRWDVIAGLAETHGWTLGAELGVLRGDNFFRLLDRCPGLTLIGVDVWERTSGGEKNTETGEKDWSTTPMELYERDVRLRAIGYGSRARIIRSSTVAAAEQVADEALDFVFIDADHRTASVLADIAAWRPKIRRGGMLMGHDAKWPSVRRAIDEAVPGWASHPNSVWSARC